MYTSLGMLLAGVVLAWFGGDCFVCGGVGLARWLRWPSAVIGVTVAAFGTSSPELIVAIHAALEGVPEISLGDVLGSNVVNVALVLALVLAQLMETSIRQSLLLSFGSLSIFIERPIAAVLLVLVVGSILYPLINAIRRRISR